MKIIRAAAAAAILVLSACATVDTREGTVTSTEWRVNLVRTGSVKVIETFKGTSQAIAWANCIAKLNSLNPNSYDCQAIRFHAVVQADPVPPPTCTTPQPPDESQTMQCPSGTTGTWTQTRVYAAAPYPTCWTAGAWAPTSPPAGACVTPPVPGGMPTADNTGPTSPVESLTPRGDTTIKTAGTVLEGFFLTGVLKIEASNVTVRNFKVYTPHSADNGIRVEEGSTNVLIEDGEVEGAKSSGITGEGFTARRVHVHDMGGDAFHLNDAGNVTIEASYITDVGYVSSSHADGVQISSGRNIVIRGNNFYMPGEDPDYNNSQVFLIKPDAGPIDGVLIDGNWLNGGGYTVNMAGASKNVEITNNRFGKEYNFGPFNGTENALVCGNVDADTGKPLGNGNVATCPAEARK